MNHPSPAAAGSSALKHMLDQLSPSKLIGAFLKPGVRAFLAIVASRAISSDHHSLSNVYLFFNCIPIAVNAKQVFAMSPTTH